MGMYPNLPLGGLNSADLRTGLNEEDLFQQLRQKQLQSQLLQANQQAALMAGSGEILFHFIKLFIRIRALQSAEWRTRRV